MKNENFNSSMSDFNEIDSYIEGLEKKHIRVPNELEEKIRKQTRLLINRKRMYLRASVIVATLIFSITAISVSANIRSIFDNKTTPDTGLQLASKEGFVDTESHSVIHEGVTFTVEGVLSDSIRTSIQISVTGATVTGKKINFENVYLENSKSERYIPKKIPVIEQGEERAILDFEGVKTYNLEEKMTLKIGNINEIKGPWSLTFPVKVVPDQKIYQLNKEYFFGKNRVVVGSITSTISRTQIELRDYFESEDKMTRVNMFYLIINGKKYWADNFSDPVDKEDVSKDHRYYVINFNTDNNMFSLSDNIYLELEYGIAEKKVIHKIPINKYSAQLSQ